MPVEKPGPERVEPLSKKVVIDPAGLIRDNPAFKVLDRTPGGILDRMVKKFDPNRYNHELPCVVEVEDSKSASGHTQRPLDHHRIVAAAEYQKTPVGEDWVAHGLDVTQAYVEEGKSYITGEKYRELLNKPEVAHARFLRDRIVTHFIRDWPDMVGEEVPMTLLAAISFLGFSSLQDEPVIKMPKALTAMLQIMVDETSEQRTGVMVGITQLAKDIKEIKMGYQDLAHAALGAVVKEFDTDAVQEQVAGFFVFPSVATKLTTGAESPREVTNRKQRLTTLIIGVMQEPRQHQDSRALYEVLTDPELSYDEVVRLLRPSEQSLNTRYYEFKDEKEAARAHSAPASEFLPPRNGGWGGARRSGSGEAKPAHRDVEKLTVAELLNLADRTVASLSLGDITEPVAAALHRLETRIGLKLRGIKADSSPGPEALFSDDAERVGAQISQDKTTGAVSPASGRTEKGSSGDGMDWSTVTYNSTTEGGAGWFGPTADLKKVTKMIHDAAKGVFPEDGDAMLPYLQYKQRGGFADGYSAIHSGIAKNVNTVAQELNLASDSPEFVFLAASFYLLSATNIDGFPDESRDRLANAVPQYIEKNNLEKKAPYLEILPYVDLQESRIRKILTALSQAQFEDYSIRESLTSHKLSHHEIEDFFRFKVLGIRKYA